MKGYMLNVRRTPKNVKRRQGPAVPPGNARIRGFNKAVASPPSCAQDFLKALKRCPRHPFILDFTGALNQRIPTRDFKGARILRTVFRVIKLRCRHAPLLHQAMAWDAPEVLESGMCWPFLGPVRKGVPHLPSGAPGAKVPRFLPESPDDRGHDYPEL